MKEGYDSDWSQRTVFVQAMLGSLFCRSKPQINPYLTFLLQALDKEWITMNSLLHLLIDVRYLQHCSMDPTTGWFPCYHIPHPGYVDPWVTTMTMLDIVTGLTFLHLFGDMYPSLSDPHSPAYNERLLHSILQLVIVPAEGDESNLDQTTQVLKQALQVIMSHTCQCDGHKFNEIPGPYRKCPFPDLSDFTKHIQFFYSTLTDVETLKMYLAIFARNVILGMNNLFYHSEISHNPQDMNVVKHQAPVIQLHSDYGPTPLLQRMKFHKIILASHHKDLVQSRLQHLLNSAYDRFYHLYTYLQDIVWEHDPCITLLD